MSPGFPVYARPPFALGEEDAERNGSRREGLRSAGSSECQGWRAVPRAGLAAALGLAGAAVWKRQCPIEARPSFKAQFRIPTPGNFYHLPAGAVFLCSTKMCA
jgi:hypothetical protein